MENTEIRDGLFREAVECIDNGDLHRLTRLVSATPRLVTDRLDYPEPGYFQNPYLIWFVADNPIRHEKLPANITDITRYLVEAVRQFAPATFPEQIQYTLGLVVTGRIPRESGKQIEMMDILIDAGATPGSGKGAVAHGNLDAAAHLLSRGGKLTLVVAVCLDRDEDVKELVKTATKDDLAWALIAASFFGKTTCIQFLLRSKADPNNLPQDGGGFHSHATALHQAVYSGSLAAVELLVEAGANLDATDRMYKGTPLGWAMYAQTETSDEAMRINYKRIEEYLKSTEQKRS